MTQRFLAVLSLVLISLTALTECSSSNQPAASQPPPATSEAAMKEPTLYTAKDCFSSMVNLAQRWQLDALPFHMESEQNAEATGQEGKATIWRGYFASRTRGTMKTITCSGSRQPSAPARGFTDAPEAPYAANVPALVFDPSLFVIDSDKAFATTLEHGGSALIKKNPGQPVIYSLDWDPKKKEIEWFVIYGHSATDRQGVCVVNAKSGAFVSAGK